MLDKTNDAADDSHETANINPATKIVQKLQQIAKIVAAKINGGTDGRDHQPDEPVTLTFPAQIKTGA